MLKNFIWLIFAFQLQTITAQVTRNDDLIIDEQRVLNYQSTLPWTVNLQHSQLATPNSSNAELKEYLKENKGALQFKDFEFSINRAIINKSTFNFQLGAALGFSRYLLLGYYQSIEVDTHQYQLNNAVDERFLFSTIGLSYNVNWLLYKDTKKSHGPFVHGDISFKIAGPGQYSDELLFTAAETQAYNSTDMDGARVSRQLANGTIWNKVMVGYQLNRKLNKRVDGHLRAGYGLLYGIDHPFSLSQYWNVGIGLSFGKRKDVVSNNKDEKEEYDFSKERRKGD